MGGGGGEAAAIYSQMKGCVLFYIIITIIIIRGAGWDEALQPLRDHSNLSTIFVMNLFYIH